MVNVPATAAPADKIKLPVSWEVLKKLADEGIATTVVLVIPLIESTGVTLIATEGGADKAYVKTYNEGLVPMYLLTAPNTKEGAFE